MKYGLPLAWRHILWSYWSANIGARWAEVFLGISLPPRHTAEISVCRVLTCRSGDMSHAAWLLQLVWRSRTFVGLFKFSISCCNVQFCFYLTFYHVFGDVASLQRVSRIAIIGSRLLNVYWLSVSAVHRDILSPLPVALSSGLIRLD